MSLDSIELVIRFEKRFNVRLSDKEAEKIQTVEQAAAAFAKHLPPLRASTPTRALVRDRILQALGKSGELTDSVRLVDLFQRDTLVHDWKRLTEGTKFKMPRLPYADRLKNGRPGILEWVFGSTRATLANRTFGELVDWVVALNHEELIDVTRCSEYDVLMIAMGITEDQTGVSITEIRPTSSFINDLGID